MVFNQLFLVYETMMIQCTCTLIPCNGVDSEINYYLILSYAHFMLKTCMYVCMYVYVYIYSPDMDIQKYTVTMKIIVNSVKISSPIGTISNSEVVDLQ